MFFEILRSVFRRFRLCLLSGDSPSPPTNLTDMSQLTFKTRATSTTLGEPWCCTIDLRSGDGSNADVHRQALLDAWHQSKQFGSATWRLSNVSRDLLVWLADELDYFGDRWSGWDDEVMRSRRAFPRLAREIRALIA